jgi:wobble nucleotide-excising tRNase
MVTDRECLKIHLDIIGKYRKKSKQKDDDTAGNSVFIKLWQDAKHSTLNHYFAFVVN